MRYGRLTVMKEVEPKIYPNGKKVKRVLVKCDCGNLKEIRLPDIKSKRTKSCGCFLVESTINRSTKHDYCRTNKTHSLYKCWQNMKNRCYNPNNAGYKNYGARGITVCDEWKNDPKVFVEWGLSNGWAEGLEIDRIDVNSSYAPGNCRFVDGSLQSRNRRGRGTSKYKGVHWDKITSKWVSQITHKNKKRERLGYFTNELDAAQAVNDWHMENMPEHRELLQDVG